jgi:delta24-sterol reductase
MDTHKFLVRELSQEIKFFHDQKRPFRIFHGGSSYSSRNAPSPHAVVHTTDLQNILDINKSSRFAMVEPNVSMEKLVSETLKHGLMPPVVPMFSGLTVGGCFAGTAGSSSSWKYGFFDESVMWCEVVLPTGKITRASRTMNVELLEGLVGTQGTIGITTLLQIKLVPSANWVDLRYLPVNSSEEALNTITKFTQEEDNDFTEGLIYGPEASTYGVIAVGKLRAAPGCPEVTFSKARDDWFYRHALEAGHTTESIPIMEYLFRHDRGAFSLGSQCFGRIPCNKWTLWLTNSATDSRTLAETTRVLHWVDHLVMQDVVVPLENTLEMLGYLEEELKVYPLQLCPIRQTPNENSSTFGFMPP